MCTLSLILAVKTIKRADYAELSLYKKLKKQNPSKTPYSRWSIFSNLSLILAVKTVIFFITYVYNYESVDKKDRRIQPFVLVLVG